MKNKTFIAWVVVLISVILVVTFLGLSKRKPAESTETLTALQQPFEAKATIKMQDLVLETDINRTDANTMTIGIIEPKGLKDMHFSYDGNDIKIAYKGMSVKLDDDSKLVTSMMKIIINSINKASSDSGIDVKTSGENLIVTGNSLSGKFSMTLNKKTGAIISINVPELDFECNIRDFTQ